MDRKSKKELKIIIIGATVFFALIVGGAMLTPKLSEAGNEACHEKCWIDQLDRADESCLFTCFEETRDKEQARAKACKACRAQEGRIMERIAKTGVSVSMPDCTGCE